MVRDLHEDYDAFYAHGIGAMCWCTEEGRRVLYFLAPPTGYPNMKFNMGRIYTMTDGQDWTNPGDVSGWDGNIERPTFHPSIWLSDKRGWHGYLTAGNLIDA